SGDLWPAARGRRHVAGALHHRAGRKIARAALLALGRAAWRHVILGRPAAQKACEEKAREEGGGQEKVRCEEIEDQGQENGEEDQEEGRQEESRQEESRQEGCKEESRKEALGFAR